MIHSGQIVDPEHNVKFKFRFIVFEKFCTNIFFLVLKDPPKLIFAGKTECPGKNVFDLITNCRKKVK